MRLLPLLFGLLLLACGNDDMLPPSVPTAEAIPVPSPRKAADEMALINRLSMDLFDNPVNVAQENQNALVNLAIDSLWDVQRTSSGLYYQVIEQGTGDNVGYGRIYPTLYHGTLVDGTVFDSAYNRGTPFNLNLGGVIQGWQEGLPYIKPGGKLLLLIPSELGYGPGGSGSIPPNAPLVFILEVLS